MCVCVQVLCYDKGREREGGREGGRDEGARGREGGREGGREEDRGFVEMLAEKGLMMHTLQHNTLYVYTHCLSSMSTSHTNICVEK